MCQEIHDTKICSHYCIKPLLQEKLGYMLRCCCTTGMKKKMTECREVRGLPRTEQPCCGLLERASSQASCAERLPRPSACPPSLQRSRFTEYFTPRGPACALGLSACPWKVIRPNALAAVCADRGPRRRSRFASTLVVADHDNASLNPGEHTLLWLQGGGARLFRPSPLPSSLVYRR